MNDGRCPLTDAVEHLGSDHGSASDIVLSRTLAERIPVLLTLPFAAGLLLIRVRRARSQPLIAALSAAVAPFFLVVAWLFWSDDRPSRARS